MKLCQEVDFEDSMRGTMIKRFASHIREVLKFKNLPERNETVYFRKKMADLLARMDVFIIANANQRPLSSEIIF
jgi:hypothetical protein